MKAFPRLDRDTYLDRLSPVHHRVPMVLDSDTYNEIDDQFALVYSLLSGDRIDLQAVLAAPFFNSRSSSPEDGMMKSYDEIMRILEITGRHEDVPVFKGSRSYLGSEGEPVESDAARKLVEMALAQEQEPLYVCAIGAITNVASALLLEPQLVKKIVVIWLGGHAFHWGSNDEFNLAQDAQAAHVILESGVPLVLFPCLGVVSQLATTLPEIEKYCRGRGKTGDYLYEIFRDFREHHEGVSKVIWDIITPAWLVDADWAKTRLISCPQLLDDMQWLQTEGRHPIRYCYFVQRDPVFGDLFRKLQNQS